MEQIEQLVQRPVFFERNRVFRAYLGGKLFHDFFGDENKDGHLPEEWVASDVKALNKDSAGEKEGVSRILDTDWYLDDLIAQYPQEMLGGRKNLGVLVKLLDSAIRLPMQAHPDRAFSRQYFHSEYGKAEMWLVLATRENAKLYFGFKDAITKEAFADAVEKSRTDKEIMAALVNETAVSPGDVYFIPPKMVHAIGEGCLILEVQEPTDFTVQPEYWCGEYLLNDYEMYLHLDKDTALDCFDYTQFGPQLLDVGRKIPAPLKQTPEFLAEQLISEQETGCFGVVRGRLQSGSEPLTCAPAVVVVTEGAGTVYGDGWERPLAKGDYFLLPYAAGERFSMRTDTGLTWVECMPERAV